MTALTIPETALVVLVGAGAAAFASRHFPHGQLLVSDAGIAERLRAGELTLVDATDLEPPARARLAALARDQDVPAVAIVLEPPTHLPGFGTAYEPDGDVSVVLEKLACDRRELTGPFDIVGDVHGCRAELVALLVQLGWVLSYDESGRPVGAAHPQRRTAVFLGDLIDRGPDSPGVLRLVMGMVAAGTALCVPGNHEQKLLRKLRGRNVRVSHGLAETLAQLSAEPVSLVDDVASFVDSLPSHYVLDGGRLVVAHAGLKKAYHGRSSGRVRSFALYGDTTGETDEYGLPVRLPWARDYRGSAMVVYGHTPVPRAEWVNNTICLDTGCVFGGSLTALRYPERELVSVPAARTYYAPARPLGA